MQKPQSRSSEVDLKVVVTEVVELVCREDLPGCAGVGVLRPDVWAAEMRGEERLYVACDSCHGRICDDV